MTRIAWDDSGNRVWETGVDRAVLYVRDNTGAYPLGVPWNGITTITEKPGGAEANPQYADNLKYAVLFSAEDFSGTIEAFTYPDAFAACDGSAAPLVGMKAGQQPRSTFGLSYRTKKGNDVSGDGFGYVIHIVYGCRAAPSEKSRQTVNDSPELATFSWDFTSDALPVTGFQPSSYLEFDSTKLAATKLASLENTLYGPTGSGSANLPLPAALITQLAAA